MRAMNKADKILLTLYLQSDRTTRPIEYERLVVEAFRLFPKDFSLRGYEGEYPNAADIHKPLYGPLKRGGFVRSANKSFALTERGLAHAAELETSGASKNVNPGSSSALPRDLDAEIKRVTVAEGFGLFSSGRCDEILDDDLYRYLGVTVRTHYTDFAGRVSTMESVVRRAADYSLPYAGILQKYHDFLMSRFSDTVSAKTRDSEGDRR